MKNILISGGNFVNKGAEAMLYITVEQCLQRYPDSKCTIQLADGFYTVTSLSQLYKLSQNRKKESFKKIIKLKNMILAYKKADLMIDVSGYELCSKLGIYPSVRYIFKIALSKWTHTKVVLLPQSFGPFEYKGACGKVLKFGIRHYLRYPIICFARERKSGEDLRTLVPKARIKVSPDLVLQNKSIMSSIQGVINRFEAEEIFAQSVALIVNRRLYEQYDKETIVKKYITILEKEIEQGRHIYLICHASDDLDICTELKRFFMNENSVHLINRVLSCFEFEMLVRKFDYVIAARYHSIVHSYKEGIPCIALGWALKYQELLEMMGQGMYLVNIGYEGEKEILQKIEKMEQNLKLEREIVNKKLALAQKDNCFDVMFKEVSRQ